MKEAGRRASEKTVHLSQEAATSFCGFGEAHGGSRSLQRRRGSGRAE